MLYLCSFRIFGAVTSSPSSLIGLMFSRSLTASRKDLTFSLSLPSARIGSGTAFALGRAIPASTRAVSFDGLGEFLVVKLPLAIYTAVAVEQATQKCSREVRALAEQIPRSLCEDQRNME